MNIYKKYELESTFLKIKHPKKSNIISVIIYRHPKMDLTKFNHNLGNLLKKTTQEQITVFLLCVFDIDLVAYNEHKPTNDFLDSFASNSYLSYIIQANRHTSHLNSFQNPIKNIFSNRISKDILSR